MLKDILNAFKTPEPSTLRTEDARIAMAALLVRIARSDEVYDEDEKDLINKMLQSRYNLIDNQSEDIRKQAEELEAKAPDTVRCHQQKTKRQRLSQTHMQLIYSRPTRF